VRRDFVNGLNGEASHASHQAAKPIQKILK
jgi:hypothetical protein